MNYETLYGIKTSLTSLSSAISRIMEECSTTALVDDVGIDNLKRYLGNLQEKIDILNENLYSNYGIYMESIANEMNS